MLINFLNKKKYNSYNCWCMHDNILLKASILSENIDDPDIPHYVCHHFTVSVGSFMAYIRHTWRYCMTYMGVSCFTQKLWYVVGHLWMCHLKTYTLTHLCEMFCWRTNNESWFKKITSAEKDSNSLSYCVHQTNGRASYWTLPNPV